MVFAIMLEIDTSKKDYSSLYEKIKSLGPWMHYFNPIWFVSTPSITKPKELYDQLIPYINGETDYLLVVEFSRNYFGWLPSVAWDWIHDKGL